MKILRECGSCTHFVKEYPGFRQGECHAPAPAWAEGFRPVEINEWSDLAERCEAYERREHGRKV